MLRIVNLPVALFVAALTGCTTLPSDLEKPTIHLADVRLVDATLFEQRFLMSLRIQNPNDFDLPIEAIRYELTLNDKPFANGASAQTATIPRYGSGLVEVEGISTLGNLLRQIPDTPGGTPLALRYQLTGYLTLLGYRPRVPFDYQGEVGWPKGLFDDQAEPRRF